MAKSPQPSRPALQHPQASRRQFLKCAAGGLVLAAGSARRARAHPESHGRLRGLADYATHAMAKWQVPGLAVAVLVDGDLVLAEGYGVRSLEDAAPVDAETVFPIGSCTKSFTAAAIGQLVESAGVEWDHPLRRHLPTLEL